MTKDRSLLERARDLLLVTCSDPEWQRDADRLHTDIIEALKGCPTCGGSGVVRDTSGNDWPCYTCNPSAEPSLETAYDTLLRDYQTVLASRDALLAAHSAAEPKARPGDDILDELEARGDDLSKRAARYIRCKLAMLGEHPNR